MPARSDVEDILGCRVTTKPKADCVAEIVRWIEKNERGRYCVCVNPHSLEVASTDSLFTMAIKSADIIVPDGIGIVIASRILGGSIRERVTGSDIFWELNEAMNNRGGCRVFFLGSTDETLERIRQKMAVDFPDLCVAGFFSPPFREEFGDDDNSAIIEAVNRSRPDVLWVGMTAPRQEKWIYKNRARLDVKFIGPIGAVFDFYTGNVKRSHPLFQKMGLEWLPRLLRQPRRLWRRNLVSNPSFLAKVISQRIMRRYGKC